MATQAPFASKKLSTHPSLSESAAEAVGSRSDKNKRCTVIPRDDSATIVNGASQERQETRRKDWGTNWPFKQSRAQTLTAVIFRVQAHGGEARRVLERHSQGLPGAAPLSSWTRPQSADTKNVMSTAVSVVLPDASSMPDSTRMVWFSEAIDAVGVITTLVS